MGHRRDWDCSDELKDVAARLEAGRAQADPVRLDQIKRNVLMRAPGRDGGSGFMRSRLASVLSVIALVGGTGGAIAVANHGPKGGSNGAANGQYKPGKGCGDKNHKHSGPPGNPGNTSCPNKGGGNQGEHGKRGEHGKKGRHGREGQRGRRGHHGKKHHHGRKHGKKHGKSGGAHRPTTNGLPQSY